MNRQEAAKCVGDFIDHFDELGFYEYYKTALEMAQDALKRTPVIGNPVAPDPSTGLVPCGCGGKAELFRAIKPQDGTSFVQCTNCTVCTGVFVDEEKTRSEWNRAMGCRDERET